MWKSLGCGVFVLLFLSGCGADHSRNFYLTIDADDKSTVNVAADVLLEKKDTEEVSSTTNDVKPTLDITPVPL